MDAPVMRINARGRRVAAKPHQIDITISRQGRKLSDEEVQAKRAQLKRRGKRTVAAGTEYYAYLKSPEWKATRVRYLKSGLPKECFCCYSPWNNTFVFHHRTYKNLGCERLMDIVPVCRPCHTIIHEREADGATLWKVTRAPRKATQRRVKHAMKEQAKHHPPSPAEIAKAATGPKGGWTKAQLAEWGIPWPPKRGWREKLEKRWAYLEKVRGNPVASSP